jgi:hypothetical protein
VGAPALKHLPALDETQPERAVSGISRRCGKAAAFVSATLEFVMAPGAGDSEADRELLNGGMFDGEVEHRGSFTMASVCRCFVAVDDRRLEQNKNKSQAQSV